MLCFCLASRAKLIVHLSTHSLQTHVLSTRRTNVTFFPPSSCLSGYCNGRDTLSVRLRRISPLLSDVAPWPRPVSSLHLSPASGVCLLLSGAFHQTRCIPPTCACCQYLIKWLSVCRKEREHCLLWTHCSSRLAQTNASSPSRSVECGFLVQAASQGETSGCVKHACTLRFLYSRRASETCPRRATVLPEEAPQNLSAYKQTVELLQLFVSVIAGAQVSSRYRKL